MKAVKTKSGKWQVRPVDHYEIVNGKRKVVLACITRESKSEAMRAAYRFLEEKKREKYRTVTVGDAIDRYIDAKRGTSSPATIANYLAYRKVCYSKIEAVPITEVTTEILQSWVSDISGGHSASTVAVRAELLKSALAMFLPEKVFRIKLKQVADAERYVPTDSDVSEIIKYLRIRKVDLYRPVILAAFGTLRRSEICALTIDDIQGNVVSVTKAYVKDEYGEWIVKEPKSISSRRKVALPQSAVDMLLEGLDGERIFPHTPDFLTVRWNHYMKKIEEEVGIPYFRFHDFRVYSVSIRHAIGIPDKYISQASGHGSLAVMRKVYEKTLDDKAKEFSEAACEHFDGIIANS